MSRKTAEINGYAGALEQKQRRKENDSFSGEDVITFPEPTCAQISI